MKLKRLELDRNQAMLATQAADTLGVSMKKLLSKVEGNSKYTIGTMNYAGDEVLTVVRLGRGRGWWGDE